MKPPTLDVNDGSLSMAILRFHFGAFLERVRMSAGLLACLGHGHTVRGVLVRKIICGFRFCFEFYLVCHCRGSQIAVIGTLIDRTSGAIPLKHYEPDLRELKRLRLSKCQD